MVMWQWHFLCSGFAGLLVFFLMWIIFGHYSKQQNQSISVLNTDGHFTTLFFILFSLSLLASFLLHLYLDIVPELN